MKKKLKEANYTLSIDGLQSSDAQELTRLLTLSGQIESDLFRSVGTPMDSDLGLGSSNSLIPDPEAAGTMFTGTEIEPEVDQDFDQAFEMEPELDADFASTGVGSDQFEFELDENDDEEEMIWDPDRGEFMDPDYESEIADRIERNRAEFEPELEFDPDDFDSDTGEFDGMSRNRRGRRFFESEEEEEGSKNIIIQLRKVVNLRNNPPNVKFEDGSSEIVPVAVAQAAIQKYNSLRTSDQKLEFTNKISKSFNGLKNSIKVDEEFNPKTYDMPGRKNPADGYSRKERRVQAKSGSNPMVDPEELEESYQKMLREFNNFTEQKEIESKEYFYVWVDYGDEQGFTPHMTFEKTKDGKDDAKFEIQDLKDQGYKAKLGEAFP